ncbi:MULTISPECIES: PRC-barrel domain-containing protein [unclassified Streptomyces]|uniref:PRC-barrel domain-containing protein n=1 Tax=unclassified Streptomyces TaxID=2593676 RepID=UPI002E319EA9|nr:PRC-barrel domain-containing protein [Streptomyces sp. NBC_01431]
MENIWAYPEAAAYQPGTDLTGYKVEATDGSIGKVDKHSEAVSSSYIVVDTGPWIFGKHVLLPAGLLTRIDVTEQKIYVACTKEQIKDSPEFDKEKHLGDPAYHEQIGGYYGGPHM